MEVFYCIVFRTGGTANYKWHRSLAMKQVECLDASLLVERMGYKAYMVNYNHSLAIGLPETYDYFTAIY